MYSQRSHEINVVVAKRKWKLETLNTIFQVKLVPATIFTQKLSASKI